MSKSMQAIRERIVLEGLKSGKGRISDFEFLSQVIPKDRSNFTRQSIVTSLSIKLNMRVEDVTTFVQNELKEEVKAGLLGKPSTTEYCITSKYLDKLRECYIEVC